MQEFNYRQEFPLLQRFYYKGEDGKLKDFGFPPFDFKIFYWTVSRSDSYAVSYRYNDGEPKAVNCHRDGDALLVVFNSHRLLPGRLHAEMVMSVPDELYPDGYRTDILKLHSDIMLIQGPTPMPTTAEMTAILPYIVGKDGKDFNYDDLTEGQKEDLAKKIADNIEADIPGIGTLEDLPEDFFDNIFDN